MGTLFLFLSIYYGLTVWIEVYIRPLLTNNIMIMVSPDTLGSLPMSTTYKMTPIETASATPMDSICSTLQLIGMVWKRGSTLNNVLVLLSSLVIAGLTLGVIVLWMILDEGYGVGLAMLTNSCLTLMGLYAILGSFTLGGLLDEFLHVKLKRPILNPAVWIMGIAMAAIIVSAAWSVVDANGHYWTLSLMQAFLYLAMVGTHLKTILIVGSVMVTFRDQFESVANARKSIEEYQDNVKSFQTLKQKAEVLLFYMFGTLTILMIFGSYSAYTAFACFRQELSPAFIMVDLAMFVSNAGMLLYLSQLADDNHQSFNSIQEPLRYIIFTFFPLTSVSQRTVNFSD